jgi:hypothetical protein
MRPPEGTDKAASAAITRRVGNLLDRQAFHPQRVGGVLQAQFAERRHGRTPQHGGEPLGESGPAQAGDFR